MGDVFLIWYDSQAGDTVVTNWGAGYNPQIVTDTYRRTGGSEDSERLLFYVDNTAKQIVYRRQLDRFQTVYTLPSAPSDVVELLKVSKNLYGGLTVLYCYDDGAGGLLTGSFTARDFANGVNIGTDGFVKEKTKFQPSEGTVLSFVLMISSVETGNQVSATQLTPSNGSILEFNIRSSTIKLNPQTSSGSIASITNGTIDAFSIKESIIFVEQSASGSLSVNADGSIDSFALKETLIEVSEQDIAELLVGTGDITTFTLG